MLDFKGVQFHWLGHDGFKILLPSLSSTASGSDTAKKTRTTVYIDPFQLSSAQHHKNDADIVLITHNHYDHLSIEDLKHVVRSNNDKTTSTTIVAAKECIDPLKPLGFDPNAIHAVVPGDKIDVKGIHIEAVPAYNTNKKFHPHNDNKVGYVISGQEGVRIYHAGDTDDIPEMSLVHPDVALVPVSGTYVMTADEAANVVNEKLKPKLLAIPMHYAAIVGSEADARRFKSLVSACPVEVLAIE